MYKKIILAILIVTVIAISGCSQEKKPQKNKPQEGSKQEENIQDKTPGIGGIHIGDSKDKVVEILGTDYKETVEDESGYFGEPYVLMEYKDKAQVVVGRDTKKVFEMVSYTPDLATNIGVKVGDTAKDTLEKYRSKYEETQSIHTGGKLTGWFNVENGAIMILDFNKNDETMINENVTPESKIEMIKLTHSNFVD